MSRRFLIAAGAVTALNFGLFAIHECEQPATQPAPINFQLPDCQEDEDILIPLIVDDSDPSKPDYHIEDAYCIHHEHILPNTDSKLSSGLAAKFESAGADPWADVIDLRP